MASDLSGPRSPGSTFTADEEIGDVESNGLWIDGRPYRLEHIYDYEPDGHHPVHLGDLYGGRYCVIHKLGSGVYANVWLCQDTEAKGITRYFALKILMAEASSENCPELQVNRLKGDGTEFICLPLDHFKIHGPNGDHIAFVYPVLGPNVSLGLFCSSDPDSDLTSLGLQLTTAIKFLHSQGMCHGDLTPSNVLHRITGLDGLDKDDVLKILGSPDIAPVRKMSQEPHYRSTAPEYLVYPINWHDVDTQFISKELCLIDFGESFKVSQPPTNLGIPGPYRSPELILEKKAGFGSDLWALGCSLFEIRTGRKLFDQFDDDDDEYLDAFVEVLGRLPEPWWSTTWKNRRIVYKDEVDEKGRVVYVREPDPEEKTRNYHPSVPANARSLEDRIAPGLWYISIDRTNGSCHRDISQTEQTVFADLLRRLLEYRPEARISAEDAIYHEWFRL